ncbi:MAG: serine/threonine-protein kinase [Planctomycetota bacterium]
MLLSGGIGSVDDQMGKHIDGCQSCQDRLERIAEDLLKGSVLREALSESHEPSRNLMAAIDELSSGEAISNISSPPRYDDLNPWLALTDADAKPRVDGYTLLECVGRGGMGVVFRAIEPTGKQTVALKAMLPELARDGQARDRFLREARAMAAVRHPNVVALHDVSEIDGLPYLVMEYVEGDSLEHRMRACESMDADEIIRIGAEIAAGVGACHDQGVIHRDIKPSNVLLNNDGVVKVTDFGLATVASTPTLTHHGYLSGTPDYVAPERLLMDTEADERSDLFSLGCLLYAMATGEPPFGGDTPLITLHRIASQQPPRVGTKNPSIPFHLEQAIAALLAKKPEDRPSSANAAKALLLDDKPPVPRSVSLNLMWLIGCFLLLAITCLAVFWLWPAEVHTVSENLDRTEGSAEAEDTFIAIEADTITVQTAESLLSAINTVANGGRIVIDTNATLVVSPLYIENKSISLTSATGRTPTLQLQIPEDGPAPEYFLRLNSGSLRLDGIRLKDTWTPETHLRRVNGFETLIEKYGLASLNESEFYATRCRFETGTNGSAIKLSPGSEAVMIDCDVVAPSGGAINWHAIDGDEHRQEDCELVGNVGL